MHVLCACVYGGGGRQDVPPGSCGLCALPVSKARGLCDVNAAGDAARTYDFIWGLWKNCDIVILSLSSFISWNIPLEGNLPHLLFRCPEGTDSFGLLFTLGISIE